MLNGILFYSKSLPYKSTFKMKKMLMGMKLRAPQKLKKMDFLIFNSSPYIIFIIGFFFRPKRKELRTQMWGKIHVKSLSYHNFSRSLAQMSNLKAGIYLEKFGYKSYFTCILLQIWSFPDSSLGIRRDRLCQIEKLPIQTHLFNFKAGKILKSACFNHCLLSPSITTKHQNAWFTSTSGVCLIVFNCFVIQWLMEILIYSILGILH